MGDEQVVTGVMKEWAAAVDSHDPARVAAVFTEDAVFRGLRPYGVGRRAVADYYDSQPQGMTVGYRILETRRPSAGVVLAYLDATFSYPDRPPVQVSIGVTLIRTADGWRVLQYQASPAA
ncbi:MULTISPECIES: SgcJ/EcaC family oxidoreductase [Mycobacteriaceae]|uniref:YybH family protein n=1 Tax=Mycobacteriaceae TaxID=1762 RepID=UPI000800777D|nr:MULTISPECIES: SgcJ/EcaC family oxidoreductase [Mycobacteriaceae]MCK0177460.1 SgcJ/EcaC family oxidoreductase [Mycolicibacterium sp. F2034L]OBB61531.1 hypothetical protein A5757_06810 [Mycobacterium sp. 852013-51886_SCH5428379]